MPISMDHSTDITRSHDSMDDLDICRICGGTSTGLHYGVITCEGCKVFFKRYLTKHEQYRCYFGGHCVINLQTRSRCKTCRFKKCVEQGMSVEAIRLGRTPKLLKPVRNSDLRSLKGTFVMPVPIAPRSGMTSVIRHASHVHSAETADDLEDHYDESPDRQLAPYRSRTTVSHYPKMAICGRKSAVFPGMTSAVTFADENLAFMLNDFAGDMMGSSPLLSKLPSFPGGRHRIGDTSTMQRYWQMMQTRCGALEDSIKAVSEVMHEVFDEEVKRHLEAVDRWHIRGLVDYQPVCTLNDMLCYVQWQILAHAQRLVSAANRVPGFTDLCAKDRSMLVRDRWFSSYLVAFSFCYRDNESYVLMGPYHLMHGRYWIDQMMGPHFIQFFMSFANDVHDLQLSLVETFLLMVISLFRIDITDDMEDTGLADFLYCHYLDALIHLIGPKRGDVLAKLHAVIKRFSIVNAVHRRYILAVNMGQITNQKMGDSPDVTAVVSLDPDRFIRPDFSPLNF